MQGKAGSTMAGAKALAVAMSVAAVLAGAPAPAFAQAVGADRAPAPEAAAKRAGPGEEVAYADLPGYIGSEIVVTTTLGTERRGTLTGASSISIVIKLVPEEGGFSMSLPDQTVAHVRLAPAKKD